MTTLASGVVSLRPIGSRHSPTSDETFMGGPMRLNRDFRELLERFTEHDVRYLIVGGWALAAHGRPRYTNDLDV